MKIVSLMNPRVSNQPQARQNQRITAQMTAPLANDTVSFGNAKPEITKAEKAIIKKTLEAVAELPSGTSFMHQIEGQQRPVIVIGAKNKDCIFNDVLHAWGNNSEQLHLHTADKVTIVSMPPVTTPKYQSAIFEEQEIRRTIRKEHEGRPLAQILETVQESRKKYEESLKGIFEKAGIAVKEIDVKDVEG